MDKVFTNPSSNKMTIFAGTNDSGSKSIYSINLCYFLFCRSSLSTQLAQYLITFWNEHIETEKYFPLLQELIAFSRVCHCIQGVVMGSQYMVPALSVKDPHPNSMYRACSLWHLNIQTCSTRASLHTFKLVRYDVTSMNTHFHTSVALRSSHVFVLLYIQNQAESVGGTYYEVTKQWKSVKITVQTKFWRWLHQQLANIQHLFGK